MTRPRVVPSRREPEAVSAGAAVPVVSAWSVWSALSEWSAEPEPPVAGALSRFSLLLPGPRSLLDRMPVR